MISLALTEFGTNKNWLKIKTNPNKTNKNLCGEKDINFSLIDSIFGQEWPNNMKEY